MWLRKEWVILTAIEFHRPLNVGICDTLELYGIQGTCWNYSHRICLSGDYRWSFKSTLLFHCRERLKEVTISTRRHVHLYFWIRVFLREVGKVFYAKCLFPSLMVCMNQNERWSNGVYDEFYHTFMSIRGVG